MTVNPQETPNVPAVQQSDKEYNFGQLRKQLEAEKQARLATEQRLAEIEKKYKEQPQDDDEGDEPYIDRKKLDKKMSSFAQKQQEYTQSEIQKAVSQALEAKEQQDWLKANPDFYEIMKHADKFASADPELAATILEMPDTFARQKLVYKNIKSFGYHKPPEAKSDIQQQINQNQRGANYRPTGIASPGYTSQGDFSPAGRATAYQKMQELKNNLRLG